MSGLDWIGDGGYYGTFRRATYTRGYGLSMEDAVMRSKEFAGLIVFFTTEMLRRL